MFTFCYVISDDSQGPLNNFVNSEKKREIWLVNFFFILGETSAVEIRKLISALKLDTDLEKESLFELWEVRVKIKRGGR